MRSDVTLWQQIDDSDGSLRTVQAKQKDKTETVQTLESLWSKRKIRHPCELKVATGYFQVCTGEHLRIARSARRKRIWKPMVLTRPNVCAFSYHFSCWLSTFDWLDWRLLQSLSRRNQRCPLQTLRKVKRSRMTSRQGQKRPARQEFNSWFVAFRCAFARFLKNHCQRRLIQRPSGNFALWLFNLLTFPYKFLYVLQNWEKGGPNYCKLSDSHHLEVKYAERHTETRAYRWSQLPSLLGVFVEVLFLPQRDGLPLVQLAALDSRTCPIGAWWESIAKDCEGGWARLQPDGSCKCEQCSSFIFASLGVFDYFWFLVHAYVAKIWDTTWYKHGQLHTSLAISPSHALIFTHFATCWKVHGMSATGQRNPLQFEYLTDFWCALAAQLDLIEGFEPWDFWNI